MPFNINEIIAHINGQEGLLSPAFFMVYITPPGGVSQNTTKIIPFFCDTASIPGMALQNQQIRRYSYGTPEKRPARIQYNDWTASFYCDGKGDIREFFENWYQIVYNYNNNDKGEAYRSLNVNEFSYPSEFEAPSIDIIHYNSVGEEINGYKLHHAYPTTIADVQVDWLASEEIMKNQITFAYQYWTSDYTKTGTQNSLAAQRNNSLNYNMLRTDGVGINGIPVTDIIQNTVNTIRNTQIFK